MKVLYVAPRLPNRGTNAAEIRVNNLLPILAEKVDLQILAYPGDANGKLDPRLVGLVRQTVADKSLFRLALSTLFSGFPRSIDSYVNPSSSEDLKAVLKEFSPDIVHIDSLVCVGHINSLADYSTILHVHDCQTKQIRTRILWRSRPFRSVDTFLQYLKVRRVESTLYDKADYVVVDSESDEIQLSRLVKKRNVKTIPLGYSPGEFSPVGNRAPLADESIVFTGNMGSVQTEEAVEELVAGIMPLVWKEIPDVKLYLVGANPAPRVQAAADRDQRVVLTGFVDDVAEYLRAASVYVSPLRVGSGMKTRILEALAAGSCMVGTPQSFEGINSKYVSPFVIAGSNEDIARETISLLRDGPRRTKMSAEAAEFALDYSWMSVAERFTALYRDVLNLEREAG